MNEPLGGIFHWLGVDPGQFRAILQVKLTLDGRRPPPGWTSGVETRKKTPVHSLWINVFVNALMGLFLALLTFKVQSMLVAMTLVHSAVMVFVGMSLISDFSNVLLDTTDTMILGPRPVSGRTILLARAVHVCIYLGIIAFSLSAGTLVVGVVRFGLFFPALFLTTLVGSLILVVFGTQVVALAIMHLVDIERFKDLLLYLQVGASVLFVGSYQLLPRLFNTERQSALTLHNKWWIYIYPPAWMAGPLDLLTSRPQGYHLALSVLAVLVPLLCLVLSIKVLSPGFARLLQHVDDGPTRRRGRNRRAGHSQDRASSGSMSWATRLSRWIGRKKGQQAAFELIWQVSSRDRTFKMGTYPTMIMPVFLGFAMLATVGESVGEVLKTAPETQLHLVMLYFSCLMAPSALFQLGFGTKPEATWIYRALPIERPGEILAGGLWVILLRFVLPGMGFLAVLTLAVWGPRILPDIVTALAATWMASTFAALVVGRRLPFSQQWSAASSAGSTLTNLVALMAVPMVVGGGHYLLLSVHPLAPLAFAGLMVALGREFVRRYSQLEWHQLKRSG